MQEMNHGRRVSVMDFLSFHNEANESSFGLTIKYQNYICNFLLIWNTSIEMSISNIYFHCTMFFFVCVSGSAGEPSIANSWPTWRNIDPSRDSASKTLTHRRTNVAPCEHTHTRTKRQTHTHRHLVPLHTSLASLTKTLKHPGVISPSVPWESFECFLSNCL